jgi:pimeloyl-ACP methyl ester carboxylesterase
VTRNGVLAISAAIAADFLAGVPTLMKSWTHPETETVHSYLGAVISMAVLLLTSHHWTFDVVAFPIFVACLGEVVLVGLEPARVSATPGSGTHPWPSRPRRWSGPDASDLHLIGNRQKRRQKGALVPRPTSTGSRSSTSPRAIPRIRPCCWSWASAVSSTPGRRASSTGWPTAGFFVIRFDNRDCGLSTKFEGTSDFVALFAGDPSSVGPTGSRTWPTTPRRCSPSSGIAKAHVVGASMGGMITQALVINHPELFLSAQAPSCRRPVTEPVGAPTGEAMTALMRPVATSREEAIQAGVEGSLVIGSPGYPTDERIPA